MRERGRQRLDEREKGERERGKKPHRNKGRWSMMV